MKRLDLDSRAMIRHPSLGFQHLKNERLNPEHITDVSSVVSSAILFIQLLACAELGS